ncbi:hypothetical protein AVEN_168138-1 [Araneus ventricosus]|uniref:Uncharacterized protein n=1 Tax=Araneus ventricosus TaxID=182803 RepID=A0A4Y2NE54_ARAVE|nr:hypothetical protein AVEN_168138-1 [Araneus ventricosus]
MVGNPIPLNIRRVWGLVHAKSRVVAKRPPAGVVRKFEERVPAQMSSSCLTAVEKDEVRNGARLSDRGACLLYFGRLMKFLRFINLIEYP